MPVWIGLVSWRQSDNGARATVYLTLVLCTTDSCTIGEICSSFSDGILGCVRESRLLW